MPDSQLIPVRDLDHLAGVCWRRHRTVLRFAIISVELVLLHDLRRCDNGDGHLEVAISTAVFFMRTGYANLFFLDFDYILTVHCDESAAHHGNSHVGNIVAVLRVIDGYVETIGHGGGYNVRRHRGLDVEIALAEYFLETVLLLLLVMLSIELRLLARLR